MKRRPQLQFNLLDALLIDNFAGGGGASTGIEWALNRAVDIAINHDQEALAMHMANHPETKHITKDVWRVDPRKVTGGRPVDIAWFSPDCKDFSKAKGGKPVSKKIRGLAWIMLKWAATVRPRIMFLENVEEFQDWGPLLPDNTRCPKRKGKTFRSFVSQLKAMGGVVEWREMRCCDYGAPTIRKRLFLIVRLDGKPIVWPAPTHGKPGSVDVVSGKLKPWRTAAECIDFSRPCPSIFLTKKQAKKFGVKRPLAPATMRRIARGIFKFVINNPQPFIVKVNHTGYDQFRGQSIDEPLQTITAKHPYALVSPTLIQTGYGERSGQAPRVPGLAKPLGTVVGGGKHAVVEATLAPTLIQSGHYSSNSDMTKRADEPLRTQATKAEHSIAVAKLKKVSAFLAKHNDGHASPGSSLDDPAHTVTGKGHQSLVAVHVDRAFKSSTGNAAGDPLGTTVAGVNKTALVTSHIEKLYSSARRGASNEAPMPTVTAGGNHIAEVRAFLIKYYGCVRESGQSLDEPMHTVRSKACMGLVTVEGEDYVITDIGMRMLEPRELFNAQGFPPDYEIEHVVIDGVRKRLPKHAQVRMCGNSVPPVMPEALISANVPELSQHKRRRAA